MSLCLAAEDAHEGEFCLQRSLLFVDRDPDDSGVGLPLQQQQPLGGSAKTTGDAKRRLGNSESGSGSRGSRNSPVPHTSGLGENPGYTYAMVLDAGPAEVDAIGDKMF